MKKLRKSLSVLLALIMVVSIVPMSIITVSAATYSGYCGGNVRWSLNTSTGVLSLTGSGNTYDYGYDTEMSGSAVLSQGWYKYESYVKAVVVGEGIYKLGNYLFCELSNLEQVELPESLEYIGSSVFSACAKLKKVNIPEYVVHIGNYAFQGCPIENIELPNNIEEIGHYAFGGNKAKELIIPDYVNLGNGVFGSNTIENITIGYGTDVLKAVSGCNKLNNIYLKNFSQWEAVLWKYGLTVLSAGAKIYANNELVTGTIFNDEYVEKINDYSFYGYDWVTSLDIPERTKYIGAMSFYSCNSLNTVKSNAAYIGQSAFRKCTNLTEVIVEYGEIDGGAFMECSNLKTAIINARKIMDNAFAECAKLEEVTLLEAVEEIDCFSFYKCNNLKTIKIYNPDCVIYDNEFTISNKATIYGWKNSTAEQYAIKHNRNFIALDDLCEHDMVVIKEQKETCVASGYTIFHCSKCEHVGYESREALGHSLGEFAIVQEASCTTEGIKNATCSRCEAILKETIPVINHSYGEMITAPTCTEKGYTTYTCECGDTYVDNYVNAKGHSYTSEITTPATHLKTGVMTLTCDCGDTYTEEIEKLREHNFISEVTLPTCKEHGYTTYTCECGESYTRDYVNALGHTPATAVEENYVAPTCTENGSKDVVVYCSVCGEEISREIVIFEATGHSYTSEITTPATHITEGLMTYTCTCGDSYTEVIAKTTEHTYTAVTTAPTCENKGYTTYTCACGDTYIDNYVDATGHNANGDDVCDNCGETVEVENPSDNCSCNCHKSGISKFFFDFILFFQRLFGANKECACGVAHY